MKDNLWKLAFVVVLATGLAYAQGTYGSSQSQPQSTPPTSDQTSPSQQQPSSSTAGAGQTSTSTSTGMGASDAQTRIQQALQQDSSLAGVSANVKGDKIELSGTVASKADKDKATSLAESNAGGKKVVDHIKVSSSSTSPSSTPPPK